MHNLIRARRSLVLIAGLASLLGCNDASEGEGAEGQVPGMAGVTSAESLDLSSNLAHVPVPPEDGPKLAPLRLVTPVYPEPDSRAEAVGYLRLGARVARSVEPVSRDDCAGGWYAVRPVGFVCVGDTATTDVEHPLVRALDVEPRRERPMPYRYGFLRAIAPNYLRVPTVAEQRQYEMRLERHLRNYHKLKDRWDALDVGANDIPLSPSGAAVGKIPDHAVPLDMSERYGGSGDDRVPWWLNGDRHIPNVSSFRAPHYAVIADRIKRHAGVAMIGTFVSDEASGNRRFAVTTDLRLLPTDKVKASSGSPFHGAEIGEVGLPIAFPIADQTYEYTLEGSALRRGERVARREVVPLTGRVKRLRGVRVVETRSGTWLRSEDLKTAAKPTSLPSWARGNTKWIDVSIANQVLVLWEGDKPVYATLVSSGRGGLGDPGTPLLTPRGTFRIYQKHVTTTMDSDAADDEFELRDVPWVMYFKGGYALHAAYWHDDFGRARSHGCINLSPVDARYVFMWSAPQVPAHWHAAYARDPFEAGTIVHIHA